MTMCNYLLEHKACTNLRIIHRNLLSNAQLALEVFCVNKKDFVEIFNTNIEHQKAHLNVVLRAIKKPPSSN